MSKESEESEECWRLSDFKKPCPRPRSLDVMVYSGVPNSRKREDREDSNNTNSNSGNDVLQAVLIIF